MRIHVGDLDFVVSDDFQAAVTWHGLSENGRYASQGDPYISSHRVTLNDFGISGLSLALHINGLTGFQYRQIGILDSNEESLAGFRFRNHSVGF